MRFASNSQIGLLWAMLVMIYMPGFTQSEPVTSQPTENGTSKTYKKHSLHIAYRVPEFEDMPIAAAGGAQLLPQPFPIILGYSHYVAPKHAFTAELGWSTREAVPRNSPQGQIVIRATRPELRLSYRWMLSKSRGFVPYLGVTTALSGDFSSETDGRWIQSDLRLQAIAGARISPLNGPVFIQLEVPYSIYRSIFGPPSSNLPDSGEFWPGYFLSQFWPVAGVGFRW